ncbi:acyl-CoA N-acyltransferase [Aspergillus pseudoustus]|uniref:Acyl-CoA N-acyltransferase n=1 Tax=Aspergillus pseudoustus TaxID=1810923 RepID=A0ABR4IBX4_9EURO
MTNLKEQPFRSERLIYRAIEDTDDDREFFYTHTNETAMHLQATMRLPRPRSLKVSNEFLALQEGRLLAVMICLPREEPEAEPVGKENGEALGKEKIANKEEPSWKTAVPIGRLSLQNPLGELTAHHRNAVLGISLIESARGKGYGREALNWVLDWAFEIAGLHRVSLDVLASNEGAIGLYKSVGFVEEGRQREAVWQFRKWNDILDMGILEHEWARLRGKEE